MLFYCSEALPSNCHPPCGSADTTTHTSTHARPGKQDCSPCTQKEKKNTASHTSYIPNTQCSLLFLHPAPHPPHLTIQSEAGGDFLGVVAEPIVARLLQHCVPLPHLYSLPHTPTRPAELLLLSLLINYSGFCQDTCMRAHTDPHSRTYSIHTHTHKKVLMQRVALLEDEQPSPVVR